MSEKQIGMELQKTVRLLDKAKQNAIEQMGEAIGLAADAGDLLLSARVEGLDLDTIQEVAGINGEQARRYERVAKARPSLQAPSPSGLKQLALWTGLLPDPIETSNPKADQAWHSYIIKARQWLARKTPTQWTPAQRTQFVEEARPIVEAFLEAGGKI
ncbi:MAG: hypothetical protein EBS59_06100 [Verrucomicrobia bacterium]|nr:hypothetical protein [Verrucomicrobiota bacterium]NBS84251.1 hypothetical protein [Verrucomicrobiota bacterium]